ncbi:hypothetical protein [Streptomyces sp. NPDC001480]
MSQLATRTQVDPAECCDNERSWQRAVTKTRTLYEHGQDKDG